MCVFSIGALLLSVFQPGKQPFQNLRGPVITFLPAFNDTEAAICLRHGWKWEISPSPSNANLKHILKTAEVKCLCVDMLSNT